MLIVTTVQNQSSVLKLIFSRRFVDQITSMVVSKPAISQVPAIYKDITMLSSAGVTCKLVDLVTRCAGRHILVSHKLLYNRLGLYPHILAHCVISPLVIHIVRTLG